MTSQRFSPDLELHNLIIRKAPATRGLVDASQEEFLNTRELNGVNLLLA